LRARVGAAPPLGALALTLVAFEILATFVAPARRAAARPAEAFRGAAPFAAAGFRPAAFAALFAGLDRALAFGIPQDTVLARRRPCQRFFCRQNTLPTPAPLP
jgi:hypothetical protein